MNDLIHNDISRCSRNRCSLRMNCARRLQLGIDFRNKETGHVSIARLGGDVDWVEECSDFIEVPEARRLEVRKFLSEKSNATMRFYVPEFTRA